MTNLGKYIKEAVMIVSAILGIMMFFSQILVNVSVPWTRIVGIALLGVSGILLVWIIISAVMVSREKKTFERRKIEEKFKKIEEKIAEHEKEIKELTVMLAMTSSVLYATNRITEEDKKKIADMVELTVLHNSDMKPDEVRKMLDRFLSVNTS